MQTKVIKLHNDKPDITKIQQAAKMLDEGGLVAFPTETVYGIGCRVQTKSLARLGLLKHRRGEKRYTLHIGEKSDVNRYVPNIQLRVGKLIRTAWPGPLTIVFELNQQDIEKLPNSLGRGIFDGLYRDNSIGIRCPDNAVALTLLRNAKSPIVAPSANSAGQKPATDAEEVLAQFNGRIDLLIDAGPCRYQKSSTVVKMGKNGWEILRQGIYKKADIEAMSEVKFLFVCTGNTCRSPMAEGMFRKYLAEKLRCRVDQLSRMGYKISSAGVSAATGLKASKDSAEVCTGKGIDIAGHRSRALSGGQLDESDFIFAMCRSHCERIAELRPAASAKCRLLAENKDIDDPIGASGAVKIRCAQLIEQSVRKRISEFTV